MSSLFLWLVYFPLLRLLHLCVFWLPGVRARWAFEKKNKTDPLSRTFRESGESADLCFEFSSEGEFEQVASLVDDALKAGQKLELVFFSPSVERAVENLGKRYPTQIRYLRYPLVRFSPGHCFLSWVSARSLILVRYDFFPEFLAWAGTPGNRLALIWASFKKERVQNKSISWLKRLFLRASSVVVYATVEDHRLGQELGVPGSVYDFRIQQIARRIEHKEEKFREVFPEYREIAAEMNDFPRERRLILGNAWPIDLELLARVPEDIFVLIVPHLLDEEIVGEMLRVLGERPRAKLLCKKGVLCELYADFGLAYVGGGLGKSVHSVLEPLVAGSERIACGPRHERSTEVDLARSTGDLTVIETADQMRAWITGLSQKPHPEALRLIIGEYPERRKDILSC